MKGASVCRVDSVVIRTATVDDVAELAELRRTFTFEDSTEGEARRSDFEESFTHLVSSGIRSGRWVVWVAEAEGAIVSHAFVGTIEKIPRPIAEHRAIGYLTNVYTRPEFRGRGIGGRVLDAVTAWALESDVELLMVWPSEASFGHYERHGFADRGEPLVWLQPEDPA
ncbi:MAG: acetyltransferase [Thermoleophilia bacterium]|nr:acetyltransferase [Thermoleophilia bacterium]